MPTIRTPDGKRLRVPDGATPEQISAVLQSQGYDAPKEAARPSANDSSFARIVSGAEAPRQAVNTALPSVVSPEFERAAGGDSLMGRIGYSASQVLPALFKGEAGMRERALEAVPGSRVEQDAEGNELVVTPQGQRFYVNRPGLDVDDVARFGGQVASYLPAGRLVRGATMPIRAAQAATGAAATDAAGQAASGQGVDAGQVLEAGGFGALGQTTGDLLMKAGKKAAQAVSPELRRVFNAAKARGVELFPWQVAGSSFPAKARSVAAAAPFSGAKGRAASQSQAFQGAVAKTIGVNLPKGETLTPDLIGQAADRIGQQFDRVFSSGSRVDPKFYRDVVTAAREAADSGSDQAIAAANAFVDRVRRQAQGGMTGKALQSLDRQARALQQSGDPDRIALGGALRDSLHDLFGRHAPHGAKQTFDTIRKQWANLKTLEPLVARSGEVAPAQLLGAVNATKQGRTAMARGRGGEMGELARIGQQMKPAQSSQTAENLFGGGLLVGGAFNLPLALKGLAAGNVGARVLDSPLLSNVMMSPRRGQLRQQIAPLVRPLPLGFVPRNAAADEEP
jgi:hypothetical protein